MKRIDLQILMVSGLLCASLAGCANFKEESADVSVHLNRSVSNEWTVTYHLSKATRQLAFARNPPVSRALRWQPDSATIEIVQVDGEDFVRRRDGRAFDKVSFRLTPTYRHLGKDYAPFSSYSDGGILVHTGRYFACSNSCEEKEPTWQFSLTDERAQQILVGEKLDTASATWLDSADGMVVYIGERAPVEATRAWVLIDPAFPPTVFDLLNANLPLMMDYFSEKFGELPKKPSFFASYDAAHPDSSGSQGGTLPNQIFMHFFGDSLEKRMARPDFDLWLAWFFAHEAAHLHQTDAAARQSWIHEGAADAFAAIILRGWSERSSNYVRTRRENAYRECREGLESRALESAADDGEFQLYYWCGLILHLALDEIVRQRNSANGGLFAIWKAFEAEVEAGSEPNGSTFRSVVQDLAGTTVADWVERFATTPMPELLPPSTTFE